MFSASVVSLQGMNIKAFEKVSVMVRMVLYVFESGSFTMKSIAIDVKGRVNALDEMGYGGGGFILLGWFFVTGIRCSP